MLPLDYLSMVMVFQSSNQEGLIHIHSRVEIRLEVHSMEDHQKEDHLIETHLEDHHLIHMLDFMDGRHLIQGYSCHHSINWL
jgi:hypothetical protein